MDLEHEMFRSFLAVFSVCQNTFAACGSGFRKSVMFLGNWPQFLGIIFQKTVYTFISGRS